jgi:hypothetical protein
MPEEARHFTPLLFRDGPEIHRAVALSCLLPFERRTTTTPASGVRPADRVDNHHVVQVVGELNSPGRVSPGLFARPPTPQIDLSPPRQ